MSQQFARGRRVRASKPKVRTGCITCKFRRVKCDEAKPACLRCQKFGVLCEGYDAVSLDNSSSEHSESSGSQSPTDWASSLVYNNIGEYAALALKTPSMNPFENEQQSQYYKIFYDRTAYALSGFYDSDLWGRLMLQACQQEPFVRHAVVALGALDKTMDIAQEVQGGLVHTGIPDSYDSSEERKQRVLEHHEYALQHYNKSIKMMRDAAGIQNEYQLRNVLISCLLIVCFEIYHGNMTAALYQAQIGINLLADWLRKCPPSRRGSAISGISSPMPSVIDDELIQAFARLERQCITFLKVDLQRSREVVRDSLDSFKNIPTEFSSLKEARVFYFLLDRFSCHSQIIVQSMASSRTIYSQVPYRAFGAGRTDTPTEKIDDFKHEKGIVPDVLRRGFRAHQSAFSRWIRAFAPVLARARTPAGAADYLGATILHMRSKSNLLASLRALTDERAFHERHLPDFAEIMALAREVLARSAASQAARRTRFMFDANTIGLLYFMVSFCRDRAVRRQAVGLLEEFPGREGAWDSGMAAAVGRWLVETEEEGLGAETTHVDEARKIVVLDLDTQLAQRRVTVKHFRPVPVAGEGAGTSPGERLIEYKVLEW